MVMTLLFQKSNFCGNFITFLQVSKLLITNYFLNFIQNSVLRCSFIKVDVSLPSPGSILRTVTHFLFAKIQMKLVRKNTGDQENTVMT